MKSNMMIKRPVKKLLSLSLNSIKNFYPEGLSFKQFLQYIMICSFSSLKKWDIIHIHSVDHGFLINVKNSSAKSIYTNHGVYADDKNVKNYLHIQNKERLLNKMKEINYINDEDYQKYKNSFSLNSIKETSINKQ